MSLSRLLSARRGPVWEWFAERFPRTRQVATEANRRLRGGPSSMPCPVPLPPGADSALVGTAVGYLLAAHLQPDGLLSTTATHGAFRLDMVLDGRRRQAPSASATERAVVERIRELDVAGRELSERDWAELCELVVVLARCEQFFRAGARVFGLVASPLRDWDGHSLQDLARSMAGAETRAGVDALGRIVLEDYAELGDAEQLHLGPAFAQSFALGGADADVICDGVLLDLKSSGQSRIVGRHQLWQLLGYLLADSDDEYGIHSVGFAALRWRRSTVWSVEDYLAELGGAPARSLSDWRVEFAGVLAPLAERRRHRLGPATMAPLRELHAPSRRGFLPAVRAGLRRLRR